MPALVNTFLFVEPDDNFLNFGSVVMHQVIEANKQVGQDITELMGVDANPEKIKQVLADKNPVIFSGLGHGSATQFTVQNLITFLNSDDSASLALMNDRVVLLTSCITGQTLGPALIEAGAKAYSGYTDSFWFYTGDDAGSTRAVQSPFLAEFQLIAALLQGKTTSEARAEQLAKYDEEILYWTTGAGKDHVDAPEIANILQINKGISIFLGEGNIAPSSTKGTGVVSLQVSPVVPVGIAIAVLGYLVYNTVK